MSCFSENANVTSRAATMRCTSAGRGFALFARVAKPLDEIPRFAQTLLEEPQRLFVFGWGVQLLSVARASAVRPGTTSVAYLLQSAPCCWDS